MKRKLTISLIMLLILFTAIGTVSAQDKDVIGIEIMSPTSAQTININDYFTMTCGAFFSGNGRTPEVTYTAEWCDTADCSGNVQPIAIGTPTSDILSLEAGANNPEIIAGGLSWSYPVYGRNNGTAYLRCKGVGGIACSSGCYSGVEQVEVESDTIPPAVLIVEPLENATVNNVVMIRAEASDSESGLASVEYVVDDGAYIAMNLVGSIWEAQWDTTQETSGLHTITVRATDNQNNINTDSIYVNVENQVPVYSFEIIEPTELNPVAIGEGYTLTVGFDYTMDGTPLTQNVQVDAVTVGGQSCVFDTELLPDSDTLFLAHYNGDATGVLGEIPASETGTSYPNTGRFQNPNGAVLVDGTDVLTYASAGNFNIATGTVEMWIKPQWNGNDNNPHVFFGHDGPNSGNWLVLSKGYNFGSPAPGVGLNDLAFFYKTPAGIFYTITYDVSSYIIAGNWYHLAASWNNIGSGAADGELHLYLDGIEVGSVTNVQMDYSGVDPYIYVGLDDTENRADRCNCEMDELRISNISRSPSEISDSAGRPWYRYADNRWEVDCSTPLGLQGLQDLYVEATYLVNSHTESDTELNAVNFVDMAPSTYLISPADNSVVLSDTVTFECRATDDEQLQSLGLYIWNSTDDEIYSNTVSVSGTTNTTTWQYTLPYIGTFTWNCLASDNLNQSSWAPTRNTLILNTPIILEILSPANNTVFEQSELATITARVTAGNQDLHNCVAILDPVDKNGNPVDEDGNSLACKLFAAHGSATADGVTLVGKDRDWSAYARIDYEPATDWVLPQNITFGNINHFPQVAHTYEWIAAQSTEENLTGCQGMNEKGVFMVGSDQTSWDDDNYTTGYYLRDQDFLALVLQRADNATHAIDVIDSIIDNTGWTTRAETYLIGDKNHLWLVEVTGHNYVAKPLDNSIYGAGNYYTIGTDWNDTGYIYSDDIWQDAFNHNGCDLNVSGFSQCYSGSPAGNYYPEIVEKNGTITLEDMRQFLDNRQASAIASMFLGRPDKDPQLYTQMWTAMTNPHNDMIFLPFWNSMTLSALPIEYYSWALKDTSDGAQHIFEDAESDDNAYWAGLQDKLYSEYPFVEAKMAEYITTNNMVDLTWYVNQYIYGTLSDAYYQAEYMNINGAHDASKGIIRVCPNEPFCWLTNTIDVNPTNSFDILAGGSRDFVWNIEATGNPGDYTFFVDLVCDENSIRSPNYTFTIAELPDIIAPVISNVNVNSITTSSAIIVWDTDEAANSTVDYGMTLSLGNIESDSFLVTSHSILLTGLNNSTLYYYTVTSCDSSGNCDTVGTFNFTTADLDLNPPFVDIVEPIENATLSNTVIIRVNASDSESGLASVEYVVDDGAYIAMNLVGSIWEAQWDTTQEENGLHMITVRAIDNQNNINLDTVNVNVFNEVIGLDVTVTTDKAQYIAQEWVYPTTIVRDNQNNPVENADVVMNIYRSDGSVAKNCVGFSGVGGVFTSNSCNYKIKNNDPFGTYTVSSDATKQGYEPGHGETTFEVF